MPVVSADWQDPSRWARVRVCWGVVRDGEVLRWARRTAGGGAVELESAGVEVWRAGCALRERVEAEVRAGARVVGGLPPARMMLRTLKSPLADVRKSAEIWPSLLDAALPFPLESCVVSFRGVEASAEGGLRCLAAAVRVEDLEAEIADWQGLGVDPELLVPEALVLAEPPAGGGEGVRVWLGEGRAVFVHWTREGFSACGGARDVSREGKTLARFLSAVSGSAGAVWVGPGGDGEAGVLEAGLAAAGLGAGSAAGLNLRAEPVAHAGLRREAGRQRRRILVLAAVLAGMVAGVPMGVRARLRGELRRVQGRMAERYEQVTGLRSPPGQERLLLERWIEQEWSGVRAEADRLFVPGVRSEMSEVLTVMARVGGTVRDWVQSGAGVKVTFEAEAEAADRLVAELEHFGWAGTLSRDAGTVWTYAGERRP